MQVVLIAALLGAALSGCDGPKAPDDTAGGSDTGGGGGDGGASDLPDLLTGLDTGDCEGYTESDGTFYPIPGAATYFYGVYERSGDVWTGEERWIQFANASWKDAGQGDCTVYYGADATETDPSACPSCDIGLDTVLVVDATLTDCPKDLYTGTDGETVYGIKLASDGTSTWFYGNSGTDYSGTQFGAGYYNDGAMSFLSEKACKYY